MKGLWITFRPTIASPWWYALGQSSWHGHSNHTDVSIWLGKLGGFSAAEESL